MKKYFGGQAVAPGVYCSLQNAELLRRSVQDPLLPGAPESRYLKVPVGAVLVAGPVMGLLFVVFLPVLGVVGMLAFVAYRLVHLGRRAAHKVAP